MILPTKRGFDHPPPLLRQLFSPIWRQFHEIVDKHVTGEDLLVTFSYSVLAGRPPVFFPVPSCSKDPAGLDYGREKTWLKKVLPARSSKHRPEIVVLLFELAHREQLKPLPSATIPKKRHRRTRT